MKKKVMSKLVSTAMVTTMAVGPQIQVQMLVQLRLRNKILLAQGMQQLLPETK